MPVRRSLPPPPAALAAAVFLLAGAAGFAPLAAEEPTAPVDAPTTAPATPPATVPAAPPPAPSTTPADAPVATPPVPAKRPRIEAVATTHDAGKVRKGQRVEVEFELANRGDAPLVIRDVQPACGCTVASFDKEIAPGATGKVRARLETQSFVGPIAKQVTVLSNDPQTPRLVLTIQVDVVTLVRVRPTYLRLLHVQSQESPPAAATLWSTDDNPLALGEIETDEPWIHVQARRATPEERVADGAAEQWRLEVTLAPDAPLGPLKEKIRVRTGHPEMPEIEIPLSGNVRRILHAQPGSVDFGTVALPLKSPRRLVVKIHNFGKDAVELGAIASDSPFVTAAAKADTPGRLFRLEIVLSPDAPKGSFEGHVKVETTSPVVPVIDVPFTGKIK